MTQAEILAANEWLKKLCTCNAIHGRCIPCKGLYFRGKQSDHTNCTRCLDTGYLRHWAWKRCRHLVADLAPCSEDCKEDEFHLHAGPGHHNDVDCTSCNGSGWVLAVTLERVLVHGIETGIEIWFGIEDDGQWRCKIGAVIGYGELPLAAALNTLRQVYERETK